MLPHRLLERLLGHQSAEVAESCASNLEEMCRACKRLDASLILKSLCMFPAGKALLGRVEERVCQLRKILQEYSTAEGVISRAVAAFEKDFWQSNDEKQGGQNGTSSLDDCVDAVAALNEQFRGTAPETVTFLLENEGATKSLCGISARVVQAISSVFSELLARKVDVSEWVLVQERKCLGKLLQALLKAVSLMDIFVKMQPPVNFSEGLLLPHSICESFR